MDLNAIWQSIKDFFTGNYLKIIEFFAILLIGIVVIKLILTLARRIFRRANAEPMTQNFIVTLIKFALWLVLILILLSKIGVEISGIITAISAILLAIGMALQSNISNLANGIVIITTRMFKKGDYICVNGAEGSITEIRFLFTVIITKDNKRITLPNSMIVNNAVTNFGANPRRRIDFTFTVAYESDVAKVKEIILNVLKSNGAVYLDPEPFCKLKNLGSSGLDFFANCWADSEDYWDVYYYTVENVYNEFKKHGVSIPYDQMEVRLRTDDVKMPYNAAPLPERVEKVREEEKSPIREIIDDVNEKIKKKREKKADKKRKNKA
ncbi:MAG: mechanosensitive ion channel [Clostridia bacterium]|nr:mechanosensitive ion channel [Clostridia bacterium]